MLGLIHRSAIGSGPPHFRKWFIRTDRFTRSSRRWHTHQLYDWRDDGHRLDLVDRSALGLIRIYNLLPQWVVDASTVRQFQGSLQHIVKQREGSGCHDWRDTYSPRIPLCGHPLW